MKHSFEYYQTNANPFSHCQASIDYVKSQKSLKEAWFNCDNHHWLWWIVDDLITAKQLNPKYMRFVREARQNTDGICDAIRELVPYNAVIRAFHRYAREYDELHP